MFNPVRMKYWFTLILITLLFSARAQKRHAAAARYNPVETSPLLLSRQITENSKTQMEKVTAIFQWITQNIEYNTGILYSPPRKAPIRYPAPATDDTGPLVPLNDFVAESVLRRRVAVCDGYARLFVSLCHHSGIRAELVTGYVRGSMAGPKFRSNHTWNAVQIDSAWYLLDATWASGYIASSNVYVPAYNPRYFLARPEDFISDHYPEDLRWTLLAQPPALREFSSAPFRYKAYVKFKIESFTPATGTIEAMPGETIKVELKTGVKEKSLTVTTLAVTDSLLDVYDQQKVATGSVDGERISYSYIASEQDGNWLHVIYNSEPILRYRLIIKRDNLTTAAQ
jgi:transglutaminase/protease-like cytokinesis protein 3